MDSDTYFATQTPPASLAHVEALVHDFVVLNQSRKRRVVLVSSGGTTVPLEKNTVRFLDNFSAGTRGAASAEHFIAAGYAVIFLHRQFSLEPYSRMYSHSKNCFLDFLVVDEGDGENRGRVRVSDEHQAEIKLVLNKYQTAKENGLLLKVTFQTLADYLFLLRSITYQMSSLGRNSMYYLAAAVSDYFIPQDKMYEHKIQSSDGALSLSLEQVPKVIKPLVKEWAEHGFIVSFKLETDEAFLLPKSRAALERYGHQLVIGNMLNTRKHTVHLIFSDHDEAIRLSEQEIALGTEIEAHIIARLVELHGEWIAKSK